MPSSAANAAAEAPALASLFADDAEPEMQTAREKSPAETRLFE